MPKLCEFLNCRQRANYGYPHSTPDRCIEHKEDREIYRNICKCGKGKPEYAMYKFAHPEYCKDCRDKNMIYTDKPTCQCGNIAIFNYSGRPPQYCEKCRKSGMLCSRTPKKCKCGKGAIYNYPGEKPTHCINCKLDGMLENTPTSCQCGKIATSNYNGLKATHCNTCKLDNMVNMISKRCKNCAQWTDFQLANKNYSNYCARCFQRLFPQDPRTLQMRAKTKEIAVRDYLNIHFEGFTHDKPIFTPNCDCTHRRRLDHWKLINATMLVIETDENQHKSYDKKDEIDRYHDLCMIHTGKWIFIRFNPDKYRDHKGKIVNPMIANRLPALKNMIQQQIENIINEQNKQLLEIIYMFYD